MTDPFAEWPPEHYETEIEREERRWAEHPPWPLDDCLCPTCTATVQGAACFGCGHTHPTPSTPEGRS